MATTLQLKVIKRRLFEEKSLDCCTVSEELPGTAGTGTCITSCMFNTTINCAGTSDRCAPASLLPCIPDDHHKNRKMKFC